MAERCYYLVYVAKKWLEWARGGEKVAKMSYKVAKKWLFLLVLDGTIF